MRATPRERSTVRCRTKSAPVSLPASRPACRSVFVASPSSVNGRCSRRHVPACSLPKGAESRQHQYDQTGEWHPLDWTDEQLNRVLRAREAQDATYFLGHNWGTCICCHGLSVCPRFEHLAMAKKAAPAKAAKASKAEVKASKKKKPPTPPVCRPVYSTLSLPGLKHAACFLQMSFLE